jgi:hypothetical protein
MDGGVPGGAHAAPEEGTSFDSGHGTTCAGSALFFSSSISERTQPEP